MSLVAVSSDREAPYQESVKARGWLFSLDPERIEASDTWALAPAEIRPWLLMLWLKAWQSIPCGSLPPDDSVVAAKMGMPLIQFQSHRAVLMRGWWRASDGRLYHPVITERVLDMITRRRNDADRKAKSRGSHTNVTSDSPLSPCPIPIPIEKKKEKSIVDTAVSTPHPTLDQVKAYCLERKNNVNPSRWVDHYTANGWKVGRGNPMKDWRAAVRTWEHNDQQPQLALSTRPKIT